MAKIKLTFICEQCQAIHSKWQGQCNTCKQWNTISEKEVDSTKKTSWERDHISVEKPIPFNEITAVHEKRLVTNNHEFDRVLGGGIVKGSIVLIGGEPGIGKSTLLLQIALSLKQNTLYISGEESATQIKMRGERISDGESNCAVLTEINTHNIFKILKNTKPDLIVIDSIQTLYSVEIESSPGSVSQIKQVTAEFTTYAKKTNTPIILVGHINKEGSIAGPKVLEHMVDVVLQFEGDRNYSYRILRSQKNRFGSTSDIGIYEMFQTGLKEVNNPSEMLISKKDVGLSGSCIAATVEGIRPLIIETQALVSSAVYGTPQRTTTGYNIKRLHMILAVLEKRIGFKLGAKDVFLNIAGGIKVEDPAIDLAVALAVISSNVDIAISEEYCFAGEIGLSGEIRPVNKIDFRINEAEKLGFKKIFISKHSKINSKKKENIEIVKISTLVEIAKLVFK